MIHVSKYAAEQFCVWLNKKTSKKYRLPTDVTLGGPQSMYPESARKLERQINNAK